MEPNDNNDNRVSILRSIESNERVSVIFKNKTLRTIDAVWINFQGKPKIYLILRPNMSSQMHTFKTHPWIFQDRFTGERMHVNHNEVFLPMPCPSVLVQNENMIARQEVIIHFPMRTLKENAMWEIAKLLKDFKYVDALHIPLILQSQLKNICFLYFGHKQKFEDDDDDEDDSS